MNLKAGVTKKESTPHFRKNERFLHPYTYTHVCVSGGKKCYVLKIWRALFFFCNTCFEIHPFVLLLKCTPQLKQLGNNFLLYLKTFNEEGGSLIFFFFFQGVVKICQPYFLLESSEIQEAPLS